MNEAPVEKEGAVSKEAAGAAQTSVEIPPKVDANLPRIAAPEPGKVGTGDESHKVSVTDKKEELSPEQAALLKTKEAQAEYRQLRKKRREECAAKVNAALEEYGCEMEIGHRLNVVIRD